MVQVLQESLSIPGTDIYLVYRSSQTSGYMSTIVIQLTPDDVPRRLVIVHLRIIVEGVVFERRFEADPDLKYRFTWDRRNAYNQKVYGIVTATGETLLHGCSGFLLVCSVLADSDPCCFPLVSLCLSVCLTVGLCLYFSVYLIGHFFQVHYRS